MMDVRKTISIDVTEDDLFNIVKSTISLKGKVADDLANLYTYILLESTQGSSNLFKIMYGEGLPKTLKTGTICKVHKDDLYNYETHKSELLKENLIDSNDFVYCKIENFLGWHGYFNYKISYGANGAYTDSIKVQDVLISNDDNLDNLDNCKISNKI
jgi:hypothetical protein